MVLSRKIHIYALITVVFLSACSKKVQHIANVKVQNYRIQQGEQGVDIETTKLIEPYKKKIDATMNEVLAQNPVELLKRKPNSGLTNWFCDALLFQSKLEINQNIDFAIQNYGGIRIVSLPKGDVTLGKVYELMPFDNILYIMDLDSSTIQMICDKIVESEGWPVSYSLTFQMDHGKATNIHVHGQLLSSKRTYKAAIPDYIANGGDDLTFLKTIKYDNTGIFIRDLLVRYLRKLSSEGKVIEADMGERIY